VPNPPRRSPRPVRLLALLFVAALTLGACSRIVGPRDWTQTAELVNGGSIVVNVRDTSGRIDDAEIDPPAGNPVPDVVANPPGQPNVLVVTWTGGACDERTDIGIASAGPRLAITITTTVANRDCDAIGIGHLLRLTSSQPLPANAVTVTTQP